MPFHAANRVRLSRVIQRLMDADLIQPEEGSLLLELLTAAGDSYDRGERSAARDKASEFIQALDALAARRSLDPAHSRAAIELTGRFLDDYAD